MLEALGYAAAVLVGLVLGLIGAGGAILTVPIMVFMMGVNPVTATVYSLFIVGSTTLIGSISYIRNGLVDFRTFLTFAIPSLISIFITRKFILTAIPDIIIQNQSFTITKSHAILIFFAVMMLISSLSMIFVKIKEIDLDKPVQTGEYILLFICGILVGLITGLVGAGGGFLIVPVLVFLGRIPVKSAIGTTLLIICANSLSGFIGDLTGNYIIDWKLLLLFLGFSIIGIITGSYLTKFMSENHVKKVFGFLVLAMGIYIIIKEVNSMIEFTL